MDGILGRVWQEYPSYPGTLLPGHDAPLNATEPLDRDDIGMMDESDRARRQFALDVRARRWLPGTFAADSIRARRQFQLDLVKRRGRFLGIAL